MNRFRKAKKEKVKQQEKAREEVDVTEIFPSPATFTSKITATKKTKHEEPEEKPQLDLSGALPSNDDFRTSLIMPKLSARFSMLREQDDPASMIGKASDDSVLFPKRASRLNLFGHSPNLLADIDEVSVDGSRPSFGMGRTDSLTSTGDGYGTDDDRSQHGSIMSRGRRTEGNNLFGGRQKAYKIVEKAGPSPSQPRSTVGRQVYEDDLTLSAFQRYRLRAKEERAAAEDTQLDIQSPVSEDAASNISSANRTTYSSTTSGPTGYGRTSTAATSIDEQPISASQSQMSFRSESPAPAVKPPFGGLVNERRRLYGQGLAQTAQTQQNSTLNRLESLSRQRAGTPELPSLNRNYSRSATNLRERLQKLAVADQVTPSSRPTSPPLSSTSPLESDEIKAEESKSRQTPDQDPNAPLSPPVSEGEGAPLMAALQPEDRGKATALGLFNKPRTAYDEMAFTRRQLQMHEGRNTPPLRRPSPPPKDDIPHTSGGRTRGYSNASYRSRPSSASSRYSEGQRPSSRSAAGTHDSPRPVNSGTFFANFSPSESEDEDGGGHSRDYSLSNDFVHPALRSEAPSEPSTSAAEEPSTLPEVRFSDLGDLKPIAEDDQSGDDNDGEKTPEKPDSPTLGPSGLGLSGLVRTHLRRGSDRSSVYVPNSPALPPSKFAGYEYESPNENYNYNRVDTADAMPSVVEPIAERPSTSTSAASKETSQGANWRDEVGSLHRREGSAETQREQGGSLQREGSTENHREQVGSFHRREGSTETQREREEFETELAERRRRVQEKLKGIAEVESKAASRAPSRAGSPVSGRQTPDPSQPKPGNAFSMLKNKPLFQRQDQKNFKMGSGNSSTITLPQDDSPREEEERMPFGFGKQSRSSSPHVSNERSRSVRSRFASFGRSSQEDSRESSRSRGGSPHAGFRFRRDRSNSGASARSMSRSRPDNLGTLEEDDATSQHEPTYPHTRATSVASSTRPSQEILEPTVYRSSSATSGRYRSDSQSATSSFHEVPAPAPLQPSMNNSPMIGVSPRPSPIPAYSANATPPLYELSPQASSQSSATTSHSLPQRGPGHSGLQKRMINKIQISEPTFVSCTSNVPTVGLPPGVSLSNGTPPVPPMNPRRRRQTTTQTILGALKGGDHRQDSQYSQSTTLSTVSGFSDEQSTFSDDGEKRPKSRHRLRKTSSEGGSLNARARQQALGHEQHPAMPHPPVSMDGGMF